MAQRTPLAWLAIIRDGVSPHHRRCSCIPLEGTHYAAHLSLRDRVRAEFETVLASVDASASIDYSADQVVRFTDKETDERILRMDLAAYNWNTGNQIGRGITVWVLEEELPEVVLTGRKGRELDGGEYVW